MFASFSPAAKAAFVGSADDKFAQRAACALLAWKPGAVTSLTPALLASRAGGEFQAATVATSDYTLCKPDLDLFTRCLKLLQPGGSLSVVVQSSPGTDLQAVAKDLKKFCVYAGFARPVPTVDDKNGQRVVRLSCVKPGWEADALEGDELVDENSLINGAVPGAVGKGKSDCSKKVKACANCSCGRKELEDKVGEEEAKRRLEQAVVKSSCGSCYLGDAFRCDGCPYKGMPAFRPGDNITLDMAKNNSMGVEGAEDGAAVDSSGKIKLAL